MFKLGNAVLHRRANTKVVVNNQGQRFRLYSAIVPLQPGISALMSM
jgi:hypothetical protein